jgi:hypothetical protein
MKLLIMQFSLTSYNFILLRSKYSPQLPVLKHPQSMFVPQCERRSFTPIQNHRQNYQSINSCTALVDLGRFFRFLIDTQSVGLLGRRISLSQGHYLHTGQHKHRINGHRYPCLEWDSKPRSQYLSGRRQFML